MQRVDFSQNPSDIMKPKMEQFHRNQGYGNPLNAGFGL
jgi:hypothetical protein